MTEQIGTAEADTQRWMIEVADQEGDDATVVLNEHVELSQLLRKGLDALYGEPPRNPDDFDLVIAGAAATNLSETLAQAGLHDRSEVVISPKHVGRG
jgi:hypothetical protein